jgi:hypothetical protein
MTITGRPTSFRREFCELAHNYCLLGATNAELAGFFHVVPRTVDNWIAERPEFAEAVQEGRALADAKVARGLFTRAVGHTHKVERVTTWSSGETKTVTSTVYYPPESRACIHWLHNRRRISWRDRSGPPAVPPDVDAPAAVDEIAILDAAGESVAP